MTDPNGVATNYAYDALGKTLNITIAGDTTSNSYTPNGRIATTTLPRLNTVSYSYDSLERLSALADGIGNTIAYTYDSSGNRVNEEYRDSVGAVRKTTSFEYDTLHRLEKNRFSDGSFWQYGYDARGKRVSEKDPNRNPATLTEYDRLGRVERLIQKVTSPSQGLHDVITQYQYDAQDNRTAVIDANGLQTTYVYDDMRRVFQEISPDTGTTTFLYDEAGNVVSTTDARGIQVAYVYDGLNRVTLVNFPTDVDITYVYDTSMNCTNGKGRLCFVQDQSGTTEYSYTPKGALLQEERWIDAVGQLFTTGYSYNPNGNLEILTYSSGRTVRYTYDLANQIAAVHTTSLGGVEQTVASNIEYEPFGPLESLTHGNGLQRDVVYDDSYRIRSIKTWDGGVNVIQDLTYTPDASGNVLNVADIPDPTKSKTFGYDELNRLTAATGPWGVGGAQGSLGWAYDDAGNRTSYVAPEGTSSYAYYVQTNRLQSLSGATTASFTYEVTGNTKTQDLREYVYNDANRLAQVIEGSIIGEYTYDADNRRVLASAGGLNVIFEYTSPSLLTAETLSDGTIVAEYIYLAGRLIAKANDTQLHFIHNDHLSTPSAMTDFQGAVLWRLENRPFGDAPQETGIDSLSVRFPGQRYDEESGLHYNYFRDYDPRLGRFVEADPLGLDGDGHLYAYARNNPIRFADATGLKIHVCVRPAWIPLGNHAYLYDDREHLPRENSPRSCGMQGSSGGFGGISSGDLSESEVGPPWHECLEVDGSEGKEDRIMDCCLQSANYGLWWPLWPFNNDCYDAVNDCLNIEGVKHPGFPKGRLNFRNPGFLGNDSNWFGEYRDRFGDYWNKLGDDWDKFWEELAKARN